MKGADDLDWVLEMEINPKLFVRDGKSLVFYLHVAPKRSTNELREKRTKLAALVRAGGGRAEYNKPTGANYRIRVETDSPTHTKGAGKEWHDPMFIVKCVEAGRLLDSAEYVIAPAVADYGKALEEFEFERVMAPEEAAPYVEQEMLARELLKSFKNKQLFTRNGKSLVFYLRIEKARNTKELQALLVALRELVRAGGGRPRSDITQGADFLIRIDRNVRVDQRREWIETEFILDSVEANVLFNSKDYVISQNVREEEVVEEMVVKREREENEEDNSLEVWRKTAKREDVE